MKTMLGSGSMKLIIDVSQVREITYNIHPRETNGNDTVAQALQEIGDLLTKFINAQKKSKDMQPRDYVRFIIQSPELHHPISIPWILVRDWNVEEILKMIERVIERVLQSNQTFHQHRGVTVVIKHIHNPIGGGRPSLDEPLDNVAFTKFKRSMVMVYNRDTLCFAKAMVKTMYHPTLGPLSHPKATSIRRERKILDYLAKDLRQSVGVDEGKVASDDFPKFQQVLAMDYGLRLVVYGMRSDNAIIYQGPEDRDLVNLYLYNYAEHYAGITNVAGFVNKDKFCGVCLKAYWHAGTHSCEGKCSQCKTDQCNARVGADEDRGNWMKCPDCQGFQDTTLL